MFGILVATHGNFAEGIKDSVDMILGEQSQFKTVGLKRGQLAEDFGNVIHEKAEELLDKSENKELFILTDLFSATPYNQSVLVAHKLLENKEAKSIKIVTGVNLPLLIEVINGRMLGKDFEDIKNDTISAGENGIIEFFDMLKSKGINR